MLTRDELAALATSVYGSEWQSALARERRVAVRTVQRWAKDGIAKPETAIGIRAYLLSRRIVDLPPPLSDDPEERDDAAHLVVAVVLDAVSDAGRAVGWHDAELLAAFFSYAIDGMIAGAGAPAAVETIRSALGQVQARIEH
jgi:hypothetical protein